MVVGQESKYQVLMDKQEKIQFAPNSDAYFMLPPNSEIYQDVGSYKLPSDGYQKG